MWFKKTKQVAFIGSVHTNTYCSKPIKHEKILSRRREVYPKIKAMFVSRNSLSGKPLSKLSCVCFPLGKLVNGKHFPVNGNTFRSTENTFQSKKNLVWFPGKCFPF
jgi:hypothetical protein